MVKIYNEIKIDISTGKVLYEDSFMYDGPLALCDDDGNEGPGEGGNAGFGDNGFGGIGDSGGSFGGPGDYGGYGNTTGYDGLGSLGLGSNGNFNAGIDPSTGQFNMDAAVQEALGHGSNEWMFNTEQGKAAVASYNASLSNPAVAQAIAKKADELVTAKEFSWSALLSAMAGGAVLGLAKGPTGMAAGALLAGAKNAISQWGVTSKSILGSMPDFNSGGSTSGLASPGTSPGGGTSGADYIWNGSSFVPPTSGQSGAAGAAGGAVSNTSTGGNVAASWQQKAVDYLIERGEIPNQFRDEALKRLGGLAGLEGGVGSQEDLITRAKGSPLYAEIMGGKKAGEESILRNASATGGLRSGDVNANMYDFNIQLQNKALLESYNKELMGLQGLAGLSGDTTAIAQGMSNIGTTLQSGINRDQEIGFEQAYADQARKDQQKKDERNEWLGIASIGAELFSDWW